MDKIAEKVKEKEDKQDKEVDTKKSQEDII
jgi:hypothetical protein